VRCRQGGSFGAPPTCYAQGRFLFARLREHV
jgi:hypothetical protein